MCPWPLARHLHTGHLPPSSRPLCGSGDRWVPSCQAGAVGGAGSFAWLPSLTPFCRHLEASGGWLTSSPDKGCLEERQELILLILLDA